MAYCEIETNIHPTGVYSGIQHNLPPPLIVFDWDDTLLATTDIHKRNNTVGLDELSNIVSKILISARKLGTVIIITNAEEGWVEQSSKTFLPSVVPLLSGITIISARTTYEQIAPKDPTMWKTLAFKYNTMGFNHIISIGDSKSERKAIMSLKHPSNPIIIKNLKLVNEPSTQLLITQLHYVESLLEYMVKHVHSFDLMTTIS